MNAEIIFGKANLGMEKQLCRIIATNYLLITEAYYS